MHDRYIKIYVSLLGTGGKLNQIFLYALLTLTLYVCIYIYILDTHTPFLLFFWSF